MPKLKTKPTATDQDIIAAKQTSQDQRPSWSCGILDTQSFDMAVQDMLLCQWNPDVILQLELTVLGCETISSTERC